MLWNIEKSVFKKLNIIDFILILFLTACIGVIYFGISVKDIDNSLGDVEKELYNIKFYAEELPEYVLNNTMNNGDLAYDYEAGVTFGEVTDIEINDSKSYGVDKDGRYILSSKEGYKSVIITVNAIALESEHGIEINGVKYSLNQALTLCIGKSSFNVRTCSFEKKN